MPKIVKNRDFSKSDLRNVNADGRIFFRCKFDGANLANSTFENAQFILCSFNRTSWEQSNLANAKFHKDDTWFTETVDQYKEDLRKEKDEDAGWPLDPAEPEEFFECTGCLSSFQRSNLSCTSFNGYNLDDSDFSEADLTGASFVNTSLDHCSFKNIRFVNEGGHRHSNGKKVLFGEKTSLEFADFSETNLKGLHFQHCKTLEAANFKRADLEGANFEGNPEAESPMSLYRVCFDYVRLTKAVFDNCDLDSASFVSSDLRQVAFLGRTKGKAAIFENSYLAGCQAKNIDFTAANFSGSFIGTDIEEGIVPASFVGATLTSANFSSAALIGVNFDNAEMALVDFDSATFTTKQKKNEETKHGNENEDIKTDIQKQTMSFNGTKLGKAVFRGVNLNSYHFVDCTADGAVFDSSELQHVKFIKTSLNGSSFEDCYLFGAEFYPESKNTQESKECAKPELSLESSSFVGSNLSSTKFYHANLVSSDFNRADLSCARFQESLLIGANFENSNLEEVVFNQCDLFMANFDKVIMNGAKFNLASRLSAAQFFRAHGERVEITSSNDSEPQAIVFRLCQLTGKIQINIRGAIIEHSEFNLSKDSNMTCAAGFHCIGSLFNVDGKMSIDNGLLENSTIEASSCGKFSVSSSTIRSSALEGLNKECSFSSSTTFESCNLGVGWNKSKFEEVKINLTNLARDDSDPDFAKLKLKDINCDKSSISALKANAESMGHDFAYDHFFGLEKEKEIEERKEKSAYIWAATISLLLFMFYPITPLFIDVDDFNLSSFWGYALGLFFFGLSIPFLLKAKVTFLKWLYRYGHDFYNITRSILCLIFGFTFSWIFHELPNALKNEPTFEFSSFFDLFKNGFHHSVNSFVSIGFWGSEGSVTHGPEGIMVLYSNIEALLGIICMALLVVTIIRRTSGR